MKRYAYFPGCATETTAMSAERANRFVMGRIGIDLAVIPDWNCCGATSAHTLSDAMGLALPARSLAIAEKVFPGLDVVTGCASCYSRLKTAQTRVGKDSDTRYMIEKIIGEPYEAKSEVLSFLDILSNEETFEKIRSAVIRPYKDLKVACYYGCLYVRPEGVANAAEREYPTSMDDICALTGATPVEWGFKTECCGAARQNDAASQSRPLAARILKNAKAAGADMIITACPMCQMNLEMRQREYLRKDRDKETGRRSFPLLDVISRPTAEEALPVLSVTELLAVAMGAGGKRLGLDEHHVPVGATLSKALSGIGEKEEREAFI